MTEAKFRTPERRCRYILCIEWDASAGERMPSCPECGKPRFRKSCPGCNYQMALTDAEGLIDGIDIFAPAQSAPNTWQCPQCGLHCPIGQDVLAQLEDRPRLFE